MDPRRGIYPCERDFEDGEEGIERMLRSVGPYLKSGCEGRIQDRPVDNGDEEGEGGYGCEEEVVEGLEGAREAVKEGSAAVESVG